MATETTELSPEAAIHELIDTYSDELYRFALHSMGNHADAKDAIQDCFIRAYQGWGDYRRHASPRTWLYTILRNLVKDHHRRKRVREKYVREYAQDPEIQGSGSETTIEDHVDFQTAIQRLKLEHQQVIMLRFVEDLSVADTARALGWSQAKVRTTQHRALKRLRMALEGLAIPGNAELKRGW